MNNLLEFFSYIFIFLGLLMILSSAVGCHRLPDFFTKMHAASLGDAVGCPLVLLGIALRSSSLIIATKIILLAIILLIVNPTASYILNQFALKEGLSPGIKIGDDND